jgi:hypothetical protein
MDTQSDCVGKALWTTLESGEDVCGNTASIKTTFNDTKKLGNIEVEATNHDVNCIYAEGLHTDGTEVPDCFVECVTAHFGEGSCVMGEVSDSNRKSCVGKSGNGPPESVAYDVETCF